ncbi:MAG: membrane dipeptidase [Candidatus Aminicenantes bacterium]|nr:membrane dipeptidase [Candidatus Aminicenantes bacterium]
MIPSKTARAALGAVAGLGLVLAGCRPPAAMSVEQKALDLHRRMLTVDTHCDTPFNLLRTDWKIGDRHDPADRRGGKIDLPRMKEGGLDAEFFAAFVGQGPRTPEGYARAKDRALQAVEAVRKMTEEYPSMIGLALTPQDARRLKKDGLLSAFIGMENGYPLGLDISLVEFFFDRGARYITLCHSSDNDICDSSTDRRNPDDEGLSEFGRQVVEECNRVGMMVDISHASDKSFYDVLAVTKAPVIASHSSARAVCDNPRNLSDDMLRALARNGGVVQICFLSAYVKTPVPNPERDAAMKELEAKYGPLRAIQDEGLRAQAMAEREAVNQKFPPDRATVADVVDHIDHVKKVIGVDYAGIGTDFDGGGGVVGCDDVSGMIRVTEELIRRGYTDREIEKIWGGNFIRVFQKVLDLAGR